MKTLEKQIVIKRPDDWHLHLRDGEMLSAVLPYSAAHFGRAIIMPNLTPPVISIADAVAYRKRIKSSLKGENEFEPLMTCYLTDHTNPEEVEKGFRDNIFTAVKLYPANATTNSEYGVTEWKNIRNVLARMEKIGMPLLVHGEEADQDVDIFDREAVFIEKVLERWITRDYPELKIVLEHITTQEGVDFVRSSDENIAATVTPHHLVINRNNILAGGIRPHLYCLPIAKRDKHRMALRNAVTSGDKSFFLGTDSAPHTINSKESDCGCAGIFNAKNAIEIYTGVFEEMGALDNLEKFTSLNGPEFYGVAPNKTSITLEKQRHQIVDIVELNFEAAGIRPFLFGDYVSWRVVNC